MKPDASPTARALLALELVQGSPGITADWLADKLGVTERAARRCVGILREAAIPIESVRGPHGGYRLGRGLRLPPLTFSAAEALGLVMAVLDGHHDPTDPTDPVGTALGKIMRALPEPVAGQAEAVLRTTAPAPDRAAARPDPETRPPSCRPARTADGCGSATVPRQGRSGSSRSTRGRWSCVTVGGTYCAGRTTLARVGRTESTGPRSGGAQRHVQPTRRPRPDRRAREHLAVGWEYDVEVLIDAPADDVTRCLPRAVGRLEPLDEQTSRLVGSTSNPAWYAEQLATIPAPYRIVRCPELQAAARLLGQRLLAAAG